MHIDEGAPGTTVGETDGALAERLGQELTAFNTGATGVGDQRGLSVQVRDPQGRCSRG